MFSVFFQSHHESAPALPVSSQDIARFVVYLFNSKIPASSIRGHLSALAYWHKIKDFPDPCHSFVISKLLKACSKLGQSSDSRLPITLSILWSLCDSLNATISNLVLRSTVRAMFLLAFHAFLRIGEFTVGQRAQNMHVLSRAQLSIPDSYSRSACVTINFSSFKHSASPVSITIQACPSHPFCPVRALVEYINQSSPPKSGPLFIFLGKPITRRKFSSFLRSAIQFSDLDPNLYKAHSFRIGAATEAASRGTPEQVIRSLGRWKSNAFQKYIRIQSCFSGPA